MRKSLISGSSDILSDLGMISYLRESLSTHDKQEPLGSFLKHLVYRRHLVNPTPHLNSPL